MKEAYEERLVTEETARLARTKSFDQMTNVFRARLESRIESFSFPSQTQLRKWLRENFEIHVEVSRTTIGSDEWEFSYRIEYLLPEHWQAKRRSGHFITIESYSESPGGTYIGAWKTYEEALEEGLKAGLKLISFTTPTVDHGRW